MVRKVAIALTIVTGLVTAAATGADTPKPVYKTTRLSLNDVAISCKTGNSPTVQRSSDGTFVVVTCE